METFGNFLRGATKVRLFHCVWVSLSFILLGFLATTSLDLNEKFPGITVSNVNSGKTYSNYDVSEGGMDSSFDDELSFPASRVNYTKWDVSVGCKKYRRKQQERIR